MDTSLYRFTRIVRTPTSEIYLIWDDLTRVGEIHLHYSNDVIHCAILLEKELIIAEEEILLDLIESDIVSSYMPEYEREDLLITIFKAQEKSSFSYSRTSPDITDPFDEDIEFDEDTQEDKE